ncbi:MAG TPA: molybdopterin-synthase adenylyltransferase MoeB [Anaerolineae bacterium]|nr:molybdopterin-synthase adenylyltransferase MoeB [Anaerolineae bacterium]
MFGFTEEQIRRYSRQIILPHVGGEGQRKLLKSKVLLIGAGGLGSPAGLYLAAAGVGTLGFVDFDVVDISNLHRQVLHHTNDVGRPKTESAKETIQAINPDVRVTCHQERLSSENALDIFANYDVIVDGSDNFPTKYLTNDACVFLGKPLVFGAVFQFDGQTSVFLPHQSPCYRCLFPTPPPPGSVPSCQEAGVFGVVPGVIGCIQAVETIKLLLGLGESLAGRLLVFDALAMEFLEMRIERSLECPVCGDHPTVTELIDYELFCGLRSHA